MLVTLNISQWTARKYDRKVSHEVEKQHEAKGDAGRYNKLLVDKKALEPMEKIAGAARQSHYEKTLAWGNNNERLLPGAIFLDYSKMMQEYRLQFDRATQAFATHYPELIKESRKRLGTMYDPGDYPTNIVDRFNFSVSVMPVPSADDFRVKLSADHVAQIKADVTRQVENRVNDAVRQVFERARELVNKIHEQTSNKDRKIYDSSIENAQRFVELLPALNLTNNEQISQIEKEMRDLLVDPDRLRKSATLRQSTATAADKLLEKLQWK